MIKVLIVEDDPMVAEFNKRYLEQVEGFQWAATAASVEEAKAVLAENKHSINLILLDIYMQKSNGLDLLPVIREIGNVDVIVISAASDIQTIKKALRYGAVDYLIKPFQFSRFLEALSAYREEAKLLEQREIWSQSDLDHLIRRKHPPMEKAKLPKGLTKPTFLSIWEWILGRQETEFSTEDAAIAVGISRVSCRKYLAFLAEIGVLETDIVYGTVGRPVYTFKLVPTKIDIVEQYTK